MKQLGKCILSCACCFYLFVLSPVLNCLYFFSCSTLWFWGVASSFQFGFLPTAELIYGCAIFTPSYLWNAPEECNHFKITLKYLINMFSWGHELQTGQAEKKIQEYWWGSDVRIDLVKIRLWRYVAAGDLRVRAYFAVISAIVLQHKCVKQPLVCIKPLKCIDESIYESEGILYFPINWT